MVKTRAEAAQYLKDGHTVGELFVDETVGYDGNTDAFVIGTAQ